METLSTYARQFVGTMERPDVDKITGLSPVVAIEQKTTNKNPRSTVEDVVHDNVVVVNAGGLADFLQRHYYDSVAVEKIKSIGEMEFFKYRLVEADSTEKEAE